jgi:outer membrane protein assembly factor BamB
MPMRTTQFHFPAVAVAVAALAAPMCLGCASAPASSSGEPAAPAPSQGPPAQRDAVRTIEEADVRSLESTRAELDRQFIIGPSRLDSLKLRSRWQTSVALPGGASLKRVFVPAGDSVFVQDSGNGITRLKSDSGDRIWRDVVGAPKDTILGIERGDSRGTDVVLVTNDVDVITLECGNGIRIGTQHLTRYPCTGSVRVGSYLIYGTRVGQVAWQQYVVGRAYRSNALGGSIKAQPILTPSGIAAGSTAGIVSLLDPSSTSSVWRFQAGGAVDGALATDGMRVFCTARDNYVYAIDINRGRAVWKFRCDGTLGLDTVCLGDTVYVQESDGQMLALAADGNGKLDGSVRWKAPIRGAPLALTGSGGIAWDAATSTYTLFDPASGAVREREVLDGVVDVRVHGTTDIAIYFVAADGRVQKAEPLATGRATTAAIRTAPGNP